MLWGGAGADTLIGGTGADQFYYTLASESSAAGYDRITDFRRGEGDKINLSPIDANVLLSGNQAFSFIGTSAFSGAAGQLRYQVQGSDAYVMADIDGDRVADFVVMLQGVASMTATDFIL